MAAPARKTPGPGRPAGGSRDRKIATGLKIGGIIAISLVALGACVATSLGGDNSSIVPAPTTTERADTVTVLARASASQGMCYGWKLRDTFRGDVSIGSNLGDGVAVDSDPARCPRWLAINATVWYTDSSSELDDSARFRVDSSEQISNTDFVAGLARLGVDDKAFIDDPGWSICRAAVFLPLLAAEAGLVPPEPAATSTEAPSAEPAPSATAGAAPAALPDAGSDFWRDRWLYVLGAGGLFLVTILLVTIGWFERRHERRAAGTPRGPGGSPGPGKPRAPAHRTGAVGVARPPGSYQGPDGRR